MKRKLIIECYDNELDNGLTFREAKPLLELLKHNSSAKSVREMWSTHRRLPIVYEGTNKYDFRVQVSIPITDADQPIVSYAMIKYPEHIFLEESNDAQSPSPND